MYKNIYRQSIINIAKDYRIILENNMHLIAKGELLIEILYLPSFKSIGLKSYVQVREHSNNFQLFYIYENDCTTYSGYKLCSVINPTSIKGLQDITIGCGIDGCIHMLRTYNPEHTFIWWQSLPDEYHNVSQLFNNIYHSTFNNL